MKLHALIALLAGSAAIAYTQDADTAIFDTHTQLTLLSQIPDPEERQAFSAAYNAKDPAERHSAAERFLRQYPQSWLLAEAYDIAARSSVDLGDYDRALQEAGFSLRLLPENPTLLVLVANMEAQKQHFAQAERKSRDALEYLDDFARPANKSDTEWHNELAELKASAYFALGRIYAVKGFASPAEPSALKAAMHALDCATAWNPDDPEIAYLRGIVGAKLQEWAKAASDLAFSAQHSDQHSDLLRDKSLKALRVIYPRVRSSGLSFDEFLGSHQHRDIDKSLREDRIDSNIPESAPGGYAGPEPCQECHPAEYANWRRTGMARMFRAYSPENIIGDFFSQSVFKNAGGDVIVRMGSDSRPYFQIRDSAGEWHKFHVDYTIGSKWQQAYATKTDDGRYEVIPIEYNVLKKSWVNYWALIDPAGSERTIVTDFPKLLAATNYQENCAICHTSQLRAAAEGDAPLQHATFKQPGIDCEMCHGPAAWHLKQMRAGHSNDKPATESPIDFRQLGNRNGVRICAQCHRQSAIRQFGAENEMNYSGKTTSFVLKTWSRPYDSFSRLAFYKDGRFRETTFIVEAFTRSACFRRGNAQCASCHSPHLPDFSRNLTSLKFRDKPDQICLQCHSDYRERIAQHTHHAVNSEASRCVACHMPRIVNALLFQARSHQIEIPTADLTERFGQAESPNACLLCHADRDPSWAEQQLQKW